MRAPAVELHGLAKAFGDFVAVDDVRAVALPGQMTAVLGYGLTRLEGRDA